MLTKEVQNVPNMWQKGVKSEINCEQVGMYQVTYYVVGLTPGYTLLAFDAEILAKPGTKRKGGGPRWRK